MKTIKIVAIVLIAVLSLTASIFFLIGYFKEKPAGVYVDTSPISDVYINGILMGKTPYRGMYKAGEITIKMVPGQTEPKLITYETKITLVPGIETIIRRVFGATEDTSSGDIISFDKIGLGETSLVVISIPENAQVSIDGIPQGFTPYKTSAISPAEHQITVKSPGYSDRIMTVKTQTGYRLSLFAKLSKTVETKPDPIIEVKNYIEILTTPTGFLRVRTAPGAKGSEIAQVKPGEKYPFLSEDTATGWIEIQHEATAPGLPNGISGWVSGQYAKKIVLGDTATESAGVR